MPKPCIVKVLRGEFEIFDTELLFTLVVVTPVTRYNAFGHHIQQLQHQTAMAQASGRLDGKVFIGEDDRSDSTAIITYRYYTELDNMRKL